MRKFTANYCYSNPNFIISNLPVVQKETPYSNIIRIIQNLIMRGAPTIASAYLRNELNLTRKYLNEIEPVKFLSKENLNWSQTIKGDRSNNDFPAEQFYNDLQQILNSVGFIRNLTIAEFPISEILPESAKAFNKQIVDFYIPMFKTVIEVDGLHHHNQQDLDQKRDLALQRAGIHVIRITTQEIRNRRYDRFKSEFREIYKQYKKKVDEYERCINLDIKEFGTQIKLTSIARFQVFILELLDTGVLSFDDIHWNINLFDKEAKLYLELSLRDLELWISNVAALFNMEISLPNVHITTIEDVKLLPVHQNAINVKFDLFKRWDDSIMESNVYNIKTDFDDDAKYTFIKINDPVIYRLQQYVHRPNLEFLLENLFGYKTFNDGQLEIIINCLNGEDTIGLLPTGGGKSLTYQICVMLQPAISFVVAPIKSLMLDQINNLRIKHFITCCSYINADLKSEESATRLNDFAKGKYLFLIISPERFQSKNFRERLSEINLTKAISIAVIDEVHCLSEWGHEFRTSYLALSGAIMKYAPSARFLALTATASSKVLQDIKNELEIDSSNVITISRFTRSELKFNIVPVTPQERNELLISQLINYKSQHPNRSLLVFTVNVNGKSGCFELHHMINKATGFRTGFYSGSQPNNWGSDSSQSFAEYKDSIQNMFMEDQIDVMVATKAFGMGIDKPNIGLTLHYGIPGSLESYYQEAGRAGRDKRESNCVILYNPDQLDDRKIQSLFGIHTDINVINTEKIQLKGDLSTQFYFLTLNLKNIEEEMNEIFNFYESIYESKQTQNEVLLEFHHDGERENIERYLYRLALIGVIEDWTIDWKMRRVEVVLIDWTPTSVTERLLSHIHKYEYTFTLTADDRHADQYMDYINHFSDVDIPFLKRALFVLLKWYNDNVIYSKKQSILLMKQFADEFTESDSFQQKIETYFKRNDDVYAFESIIGKRNNLSLWNKIFVVQVEGKEDMPRAKSTFKSLKITVSRFLESYKNDIALNLVSGLLSLAEDEFETVDGKERLVSAIRDINQLDSDERSEMLQSILVTSDQYLNLNQKDQLSEILIANGFDQMPDLKQIYQTFESNNIYAHIIKSLYSSIKQQSVGGYPWET